MATKAKKTAAPEDSGDDLLAGDGPSDDLLAGDAKPAAKTKGKAKASAKPAKAAAKPAKAAGDKPPKAAKAPKEGGATRGVKGSGKFYIDPDEFIALQKKIATQKKPATSKELGEKFEVPTWKARSAAAALAKQGKGSMTKSGSVLVYTPS